ncbi:MAG: hypothetical protein WD468_10640 [Pirellulales bacterium]
MKIFRLQAVLALALVVWSDSSAGAQDLSDLPVAMRGTVKVRSRAFNPFETGQSRLTINPFGLITFTNLNPTPLAAPAVNPASSSAVTSAVAVATASDSGSPIVPVSGYEPPGGGDDPANVTSVVRPPFRPPTRSPWRPPPRPPFLPP